MSLGLKSRWGLVFKVWTGILKRGANEKGSRWSVYMMFIALEVSITETLGAEFKNRDRCKSWKIFLPFLSAPLKP